MFDSILLPISEDYIQTLGVNFMEKTVSIRSTDITFSVSYSSNCHGNLGIH